MSPLARTSTQNLTPLTPEMKRQDGETEEKQEAMSCAILASLCFPLNLDLSQHSGELSQSQFSISLDDLRRISIESNKQVVKNSFSRQGRALQRISVELGQSAGGSEQEIVARLTTGTIPILNDGRILLVSSNKAGWVIPKGGWEQDETLPVGAIRETYEEAGVVGLLGAPLPSITYETNKARKRRLGGIPRESEIETLSMGSLSPSCYTDVASAASSKSSGDFSKHDDSRLVTPDPKNTVRLRHEHTHNRLTMFVLYVQQVYEEWPEQHRQRRAVTIEEAEVLLSHRPEFLAMLQTVRKRKLNHMILGQDR